MTDPQASPRRIWDGELDPEDEPATAAAAAGVRRRPDTSYRWEPARLPGPGKPGHERVPAQLAALVAVQGR